MPTVLSEREMSKMSVLKLENISMSYKDAEGINEVLKNIDLELDKGEFIAIVGPSGSGKSTLLSIAGMLLNPSSGHVLINNQSMDLLKNKDQAKTRLEEVGFIFQTHHLLPYLKAYDQVDMLIPKGKYSSKEEKKSEIIDLFKHLGIEDCMNKYPRQMSGGQRQRVAIARSFMNKPSLILADEPTASLDSKRGREVVEMISKEVKRHQVGAIMVTHDERVLDLVDKVYRLESGQLILNKSY